jgi:DNA-binding NarL/FixJ family response regulator
MTPSVLVVDDDPAFRDLAVRMLTAANLNVVGEAGTAAEALAAAVALKPEAALVDVDLPDGSGVELAGELTALPWRPRIVLTSVDVDAAGPDDVRRTGASAFVHKGELPSGAIARLLAGE